MVISFDSKKSDKDKRDKRFIGNGQNLKIDLHDIDDVRRHDNINMPLRNKLSSETESSDSDFHSSMEEDPKSTLKSDDPTDRIGKARERVQKMKADFDIKKEKREREVIAADEQYCKIISKHQEEYGELEV